MWANLVASSSASSISRLLSITTYRSALGKQTRAHEAIYRGFVPQGAVERMVTL
jgi:hypothetical protein